MHEGIAGLPGRAFPYYSKSLAMVGTRGPLRRLATHLGNSHSRSTYKDVDCKEFYRAVATVLGYPRVKELHAELKQTLQEIEMESAKTMTTQCKTKCKCRTANILIVDNSVLEEHGREQYTEE